MDRFIACSCSSVILKPLSLKSNMDRFIGFHINATSDNNRGLKSNMDRFIASIPLAYALSLSQFKIQYG